MCIRDRDEIAPDIACPKVLNSAIDLSMLKMEKEIGKGSFGVVWLASYKKERMAVKQMEGDVMRDIEVLRDFQRELWIGCSLDHPNLVKLVGCSITPKCLLMMEYIPHGNLYDVLHDSSKQIGWRSVMKIASDIASGMSFLHNMDPPFLHRDLKTPNILLASLDPRASVMAKITDFGETQAFVVQLKGRDGLMNPFWLAPEVMTDQPYSEKMDVYSFGIILWELHVRQHPYSEYPVSSNFASKLENAIIDGLRPTFGPRWTAFPDLFVPLPHTEYVTLAEECWSPDPEDRPDFNVILNRLHKIRIHTDCHEPQPNSVSQSSPQSGVGWTRGRSGSSAAGEAQASPPRNLLLSRNTAHVTTTTPK
eukprot:TRINITY_DN584_c0_g1_i2.p1 TRINITY_DN584_c0_g1~~TRINITY_DN584_c0_g1_i2.p1  ORF type:complete len:364 (-),score=55.04 TRINITY_DN584_c0_g1_i2:127-1218(-)